MTRGERLLLFSGLVAIILLLSSRRFAGWLGEFIDGLVAPPGEGLAEGATGAPGAPGLPAAPGGLVNLADLAAAIRELAAGVLVPNIITVTASLASGTVELVPAEAGKRIFVIAYGFTTVDPASTEVTLWSDDSTRIWRIRCTPVSGGTSVGANLAVAWPAYICVANYGEPVKVQVTGAVLASLTYWTA